MDCYYSRLAGPNAPSRQGGWLTNSSTNSSNLASRPQHHGVSEHAGCGIAGNVQTHPKVDRHAPLAAAEALKGSAITKNSVPEPSGRTSHFRDSQVSATPSAFFALEQFSIGSCSLLFIFSCESTTKQ